MTRVLFVCMGNICRSPLAEAVLRHQAAQAGLELIVDSAGIGDWHRGEASDPRAIRVGEARGYRMDHRARQVRPSDFEAFDLILPMDHENLHALNRWAGARKEKVRLVRSFDPNAESEVVADPYYDTEIEFQSVLDQLETAGVGIIEFLQTQAKGSKPTAFLE